MSLWGAIKRGNIDYLWIDEETVANSNKADRGLDELNRKRMEDVKISAEEYQRRQEKLTQWAFDDVDLGHGPGRLLDQPGVSPWEGFQEGAAEGAANIRKTVSGAINGVVGTSLKLIPWQIWVGVIIYALIVLWPYLPKPGKK